MDKLRKKSIIYIIITAVLWSMGGLFIKLIDWNPIAIAGARSGIASIVMFAYLRKPIKQFNKNKVLGALSYVTLVFLFVSANKLTTSANAILLQFTAPIWVALLSFWFLKERPVKSDWIAIVAVMLGMVLFFIGDLGTGNMFGNFLAVLSGVAMAFMVIFLKLQGDSSPVEMTLLGNIFTFLLAIPFLFFIRPTWQSIVSILILGVFQLGISYIFYTLAINHVSAVEAIIIPIIEPLLNPVWVFLVTKEAPSSYALLGGLLVISTVIAKVIYQEIQNKKIALEKVFE
ncbi:DMT family transporter [Serpentinicella alkaliphila]|uniref:Threonine/homoserine efflux transporter RhtA n=1 Tax=Serpentinicella alkaliphila TaxID=1734049 RepID=A0A4R2U2A2_9FIRM|nr:DMT family transporter [Serpentinicella alkaliphila]QUH26710.1 DMT family transporter [Serpentinicella alkaliphila]TCQ07925.1 threonine/homoserine efflux transporter RhtA [Serpentinicella alkaliphila]